MSASTTAATAAYCLQLADNALILGQRNAEWCSNGPTLEEDIAQANLSLDLIGQSRLLYQRAGSLESKEEDHYAYFREAGEFRNLTLLELPHFDARDGLLAATAKHERDYGTTIARNFLYSVYALLQWHELQRSTDADLAAIAAKSLKEVRYHVRVSRDWLVRLGDGTGESRSRIQGSINALWPYTQEFFELSPIEEAALLAGVSVDPRTLRDAWSQIVNDALAEATLQRPAEGGYVPQGKRGLHSVHLSCVLAEMQSLARAHPQAVW